MKTLIQYCDRFLQRFLPDPFVIAIFLTVLTIGLAIFFRQPDQNSPHDIVRYWGNGFWDLAKFTLQMAMILIGGYVVATSKPVKSLLKTCVSLIHSPIQAVLFCTIAAIIASWINWGFGLVVGGIVALEVGRKLPNVPFRVLVASSYSGFLVWHGGLSGSIPLVLNSESNVSTELIGEMIPLSQTTFSLLNLVALGAMLILLPMISLLNLKICGDEPAHFSEDEPIELPANEKPKTWLNGSILPVAVLFALVAWYWYVLWDKDSFNLDLNSVNLIFFMLGMLLHGSPGAFIKAVTDATPKIAPILIQYPLYAAIMAVLKESGLAEQISQLFVDYSSKETFPLMTFYSAGFLNLLVPSGGGQWAVQAPIVVNAARELGVEIPRVAMAVAWGDAWTNMAQPFWAIPLLTIAGLSIKDIMGFCLVTLFASGIVLSLIFLIV